MKPTPRSTLRAVLRSLSGRRQPLAARPRASVSSRRCNRLWLSARPGLPGPRPSFGSPLSSAMVACGRARELSNLELHPLLTGGGGNDPQRVRARDGATAWRCALKTNSPSAPRLHYWSLPHGAIVSPRLAHTTTWIYRSERHRPGFPSPYRPTSSPDERHSIFSIGARPSADKTSVRRPP